MSLQPLTALLRARTATGLLEITRRLRLGASSTCANPALKALEHICCSCSKRCRKSKRPRCLIMGDHEEVFGSVSLLFSVTESFPQFELTQPFTQPAFRAHPAEIDTRRRRKSWTFFY